MKAILVARNMIDIPLTKKKSQWAKGRNVNLLGNKLAHNASIQQRYARKLHKLVQQMTQETLKQIKSLYRRQVVNDSLRNQVYTLDINLGSQARITMNYLTNKFTKLFASKAKNLADQMFGQVDKTSKTNLHSSLKQLSGGLSLKTGIVTPEFEEIASATIAEKCIVN